MSQVCSSHPRSCYTSSNEAITMYHIKILGKDWTYCGKQATIEEPQASVWLYCKGVNEGHGPPCSRCVKAIPALELLANTEL